MGRTKTEKYSEIQIQFAGFNRGLSCPARVAILEYLLSRKSSTAGHVIQALTMDQGNARQHLKALVESGLVVMQIEPKGILYKANYVLFGQWYKMILRMHNKFDDLRNGRPGYVFDINKIDPSIWDEEMAEIISSEESVVSIL